MRSKVAVGPARAAPATAHILDPLLGEVKFVRQGVYERLERSPSHHGDLNAADDRPVVEGLEEIYGQGATHRPEERILNDHKQVNVALRPEVAAHRQRPVQVHTHHAFDLADVTDDGLHPLTKVFIGSRPVLWPARCVVNLFTGREQHTSWSQIRSTQDRRWRAVEPGHEQRSGARR